MDENTGTTTNRSDFTWPRLAERQRIIDWDRYEYKRQQPSGGAKRSNYSPVQQSSLCWGRELLPFDFYFRPKPIVARQPSVDRCPNEKTTTDYDKYKADSRIVAQRTRPRVLMNTQISIDDLPDDKREKVCAHMYISSKTMSEVHSGVPAVADRIFGDSDVPSKLSSDPVKCRWQPLSKPINPPKNWRRIGVEWDSAQTRICGGRSLD